MTIKQLAEIESRCLARRGWHFCVLAGHGGQYVHRAESGQWSISHASAPDESPSLMEWTGPTLLAALRAFEMGNGVTL